MLFNREKERIPLIVLALSADPEYNNVLTKI